MYKSGRRLGVGYNRSFATVWRDSYQYPHECGVHAEMSALRAAPDTVGATLYVVRVRNDGTLGLSAPCTNCHNKLVEAGIRCVVFSGDNGAVHKHRI